jgi:acyl-CoA dehydrogenase
LRAMEVYGHDDAPHGHMHFRYDNVRVPADHLLLGEGCGFEIAKAGLAPGASTIACARSDRRKRRWR